MRTPNYSIVGHYFYNEQIKYIRGAAAITEEGYLEAVIVEDPDKKHHELEGAVIVLDDIMIINALETARNDDPRIFYYLEKKMKNPSEPDFEGTYIGVRHNYHAISDVLDDKWPETANKDIIKELVKSMTVVGEERKHAAMMELKRLKK